MARTGAVATAAAPATTAPAATNGKASRPGPQRHPHPLYQHRADASDAGRTIALATTRPMAATRPNLTIRTPQLPAVSSGTLHHFAHIRSDPEKHTRLGESAHGQEQKCTPAAPRPAIFRAVSASSKKMTPSTAAMPNPI